MDCVYVLTVPFGSRDSLRVTLEVFFFCNAILFHWDMAIRDILGETEKNHGAKERKPKGKE